MLFECVCVLLKRFLICFEFPALLSDAEAGEDVAEDVVGGDFAGDFAEVVHCFANVLAHEVAADAVV